MQTPAKHDRRNNAVVSDNAVGQSLESAFDKDLRNCVEVTAYKWAQRPFADRFKAWMVRRVQALLYWSV